MPVNPKTLEKVSDFVGKYMAAIVIVVAALALLFPGTFSVVKTAWVNTLLGIVMFGMGLTLKPEDFKVVFSRPKDVIIGCIAQFTLMPFLAWALTQLFHLPTELAIGVILVGTCPGGTSSNVMTYLSKGDVALSVGMTAVSTVLAPFLTPLLTLLYTQQTADLGAAAATAAAVAQNGFAGAMALELSMFAPYNLLSFRLIPAAYRAQTTAAACAGRTRAAISTAPPSTPSSTRSRSATWATASTARPT